MKTNQRAYVTSFPYQNIVGALLYLALNEISYAVGVLARFNTNPNFRACKALVRLLLYLKATPTVGIKFTGTDLKLFAYSDDDWAGDLDTRRSTTVMSCMQLEDQSHGDPNCKQLLLYPQWRLNI